MIHRKRQINSILVIGLFLFSAVALQGADVSGVWTCTIVAADGTSEKFLLVLSQDVNKLTGTAGGNQSDRHTLEKGAVEGDRKSPVNVVVVDRIEKPSEN